MPSAKHVSLQELLEATDLHLEQIPGLERLEAGPFSSSTGGFHAPKAAREPRP